MDTVASMSMIGARVISESFIAQDYQIYYLQKFYKLYIDEKQGTSSLQKRLGHQIRPSLASEGKYTEKSLYIMQKF